MAKVATSSAGIVAQQWVGRRCEAGVRGLLAQELAPCDRRGRWWVSGSGMGGVVLCGTCKRELMRRLSDVG